MQILLVDDEANLLAMTKQFLEKEDAEFKIDTTTSAESAMSLIRENHYDVVVSDYAMPDMDGLDLLEKVRQESDIPFILFTGKGREEVAMQALNLGADRYLQKGHDVRVTYGMLADAIAQEAEHYKSDRARRKAEQRYKLIAKHIPNGMVHILDKNLRYVFNAGEMLKEIGLSNEKLVGKTVGEVLPEATAEMVERHYRRALNGHAVTFEGDYVGKYFLLNVIPLQDDAEEIEGILVLTVDITERKKIEEEREDLIAELRAINRTIIAASQTEGVNKICQLLAETVHSLNEGSIVAVTLYDQETKKLTLRSLIGLGRIRNKVLNLFGENKTKFSLNPEIIGENANLYTSGELEHIPGGLHGLMAGKASRTVCKAAEKLMGTDSVYAVGFELGDERYGGVIILPPKNQEIRHKSAIESLTSHVSQILQRRQAEDELRQSDTLHRAIFENTGAATAFIEEDMTISLVNSKCEELSGYSKEEIEGKMRWTDFALEEDSERMKKYHGLRRERPDDVPNRYEFRFVTKSGEIKHIDLLISMIPGTKKSIASLVDITDYKEAQKEIENLNSLLFAIRNINQVIVQESDFRTVLEKTCDFLIEARGYLGCSIGFIEKSGDYIRPMAKTGKLRNIGEWAITPEGEGTAPDCVKTCISTGKTQMVENTAACKECSYLFKNDEWHRNVVVPIVSGERPIGILRVVVSRTASMNQQEMNLLKEVADDLLFEREKYAAEMRLRESEKRARSIMEASLDAIALLDREGRVLDCNKRYANRFGKKPEEVIGNKTWKLHPDVSPQRRRALEKVFDTGKPYHDEDVREAKNGTPIWNEYIISPIPDDSGNVQYVCLYARDITKRKKAELRLAESEKEKALILENAPFHILLQDTDHRVIWANRAAAESVGQEIDRLKGRKCHKIWADSEVPCDGCPIEESWKKGGPDTQEMKTPDGRWWLVTGSGVENDKGETMGAVEITLDVTKRKMAERRTDFLISLLRHDVLNRIQAVQGFLELLKHTNLTGDQDGIVEKAIEGTKEQQDIIERVRLLRKVEEEEKAKTVDLGLILEDITERKNLQPFGREFTIETDLPKDDLSVQGGRLLKPLFDNLIENSLEHSNGTKISVSVRENNDFVVASVEDDGTGIPRDVQNEIMQARFDDEESRSSGLGLYLVKEIAEAYGGRIEICDSDLGGARVNVYLRRIE